MRGMSRLVVPVFVLMSVAMSAPQAGAVAAQAAAKAGADSPAAAFIQNLGDHVIKILADHKMTRAERTARYREILGDAFDLKTIGHFVIGRAWNTATPEQRDQYMKLFEKLVLKTYGNRLNFYNGEALRVDGVRPESARDSIVESEITHPDGSPPTRVDWRVRNEGGKQAIIDVMVEGVSQSVTQRQEYASIIERDGGKLDGLLNLMQQRVNADN